jgi:hypothetical protein
MAKFEGAERKLGLSPFRNVDWMTEAERKFADRWGATVQAQTDDGEVFHFAVEDGNVASFDLWLTREGLEAIRDVCNVALVIEPAAAPEPEPEPEPEEEPVEHAPAEGIDADEAALR